MSLLTMIERRKAIMDDPDYAGASGHITDFERQALLREELLALNYEIRDAQVAKAQEQATLAKEVARENAQAAEELNFQSDVNLYRSLQNEKANGLLTNRDQKIKTYEGILDFPGKPEGYEDRLKAEVLKQDNTTPPTLREQQQAAIERAEAKGDERTASLLRQAQTFPEDHARKMAELDQAKLDANNKGLTPEHPNYLDSLPGQRYAPVEE